MDGINPSAIVQKVQLTEESLRIQVPCSISISGPSQSNLFRKEFTFKKAFSAQLF
jgi:hypothetical protein